MTRDKMVLKFLIWEGRKEISMQESSVNLTTLEGSTELISCATGLKFENFVVTICASLLTLTWWKFVAWSGAIHIQKKAIMIAVYCQSHHYFAHYLASKVHFKASITSSGIMLPFYETMQTIWDILSSPYGHLLEPW